jgi:putative oxidoreductase
VEPVDLGLAIIRVVVGLFLAAHGLNKVVGGGGLAGTSGWFGSMGMRWPRWQARMAAGSEITAGVLFAVGFVSAFAGGVIIALMIVAGVTAHRNAGFFVFRRPTEGWEYVAALGACALGIATTGAGYLSVDNAAGWHLDSWWGLVVAVVVGGLGAATHLALSWRPGQTFS